MSNISDEWKKKLDDFESSVSKELSEIRKHKAEIQQMKADIFSRMSGVKYIRDDRRIIISAPEIVIGNVDASGDLSGDGGLVVIKGSALSLDGVGENGTILTRASIIQQQAVDPGPDGLEAVVQPTSVIASQAKNIVLQSNDSEDCFSQRPATKGKGVRIHSDTTMEISASVSAEERKKEIEKRLTDLKQEKMKLSLQSQEQKVAFNKDLLQLELLKKTHDALNTTDDVTSVSYTELYDLQKQAQELMSQAYNSSLEFINTISTLAELTRQVDALEKEKNAIKTGDDFKKNTTKAALSIEAEHINMLTMDGDGNFKENEEAGMYVNTPRMYVTMQKEDGSLTEQSNMTLISENVSVSTADPKVSESSTDMPAKGNVNVYSKNINLVAIDGEVKDKKFKEKALTKDGKITIRAEKTDISATDTEGKATGAISVNAKSVAVKSMDVDKDKRTDKELAKGSSMLLLSEKMYVGAKDDKNKSKSMQAVSEEIGLFADKTLEAQQDKGKALVQLSGGNTAIGGSKTEIYGATTIQAKTEIKDELKAPKATIDHVEAKSSFKSSNISDGIPVPAPPASAKLSAKLKAEDAPKEQ